jgi:hypothetical protein
MVSISSNADKIINRIKQIKINSIQEINIGIQESAMLLQEEVKSSIAGERAEPRSVDTGAFLNSIDIENGVNYSMIYTDLEYPKYLEWGTSRIDPRGHFTNSLNRLKDTIVEKVQAKIKIAVEG